MDQEIKVCSYNYYSAKRNIDTIRYLISNCDIFACQETLLLPDNVQLLVKDDNYLTLAMDHWLVQFVSH